MWGERIVGRDRELGRLRGALEEAADGRGGVWLLTGEPGIGKTRLAEASAEVAREAGFACAWGRCWEAGGAPAFWPWSQVVRSLARLDARDQRPPILDALLPERAELGAAGGARFELFAAFEAWLSNLSTSRPLWIGLEDLHAADPASLALLEALLAPLSSVPILVVATVRHASISAGPLAPTYRRIERKARLVPLRRLEAEDAAALLEATLAPGSALLAAALEATAGHPLFIVELLRLLEAASPGAELAPLIPASVHAVLEERLEGLSPPAREVVARAALIGMDVDRELLARMVGEAQADDALREAVAASLVQPLAARALRFSHALLRDALSAHLDAGVKQRMHGEIAAALAAQGAPAAGRAHHLHRAGPGHAAAALDASLEAAADALARFAFEDVLVHAELARALAGAGDVKRLARAGVLQGLGLLGLGRVDEGRRACLEAADRVRGDAVAFTEAVLAYGSVYRFVAVDPLLVALLEEALERLPAGDSALRARALSRLAAARQPDPVPARPIALAREAIAMAERLGASEVLVAALRAGSSAMVDIAPPDDRLELDGRHLELASRLGLSGDEVTARQRLIFDHLELGRFAEAEAHLAQVTRLVEEGADRRGRWRGPALRALTVLWTGDLAQARRLMEEAHVLGSAAGDPNAAACHALQRARLLELVEAEEEEIEAAAEALRASMCGSAIGERLGAMTRAGFLLHLGRTEAGLAAADRALVSEVLAFGDRTLRYATARWAAVAQDAEVGRVVLEELRGYADGFSTHGVLGLALRGPTSVTLAWAAAATGDLDAALRWAEDAAARALAVGGRPAAAEAHALAAELAGRLGRDTLAAEHRARASALARDAGLGGLERRMRDATPPSSRRERAPAAQKAEGQKAEGQKAEGPVFTDEGEVWAITWRGRSLRLKGSKGLAVLAHLVERPGVSVHVLDLAHLGGPAGPVDAGDAGELLDARARSAYRARAAELREILEEAEANHDRGRIEAAREELEQIADALLAGTGLSGRSRRAAGAQERARQAVRKQVRSALDRIADLEPELARHLERAVQTGRTCAYEPLD